MPHTSSESSGASLRQTLPGCRLVGASDLRVQSLSSDSRRCRPGDLFVALLGPQHDGHDHAAVAVRRGATAVVAERLLPLPVPQCLVRDSREAYSRLCLQLAGRPHDQLRLVGVTGSSGKTVTTMLMASVLAAGSRRVGVTSSVGHSDSVDTSPPRDDTPRAPELATWLARMTASGCQDAVLELSSRALAERRAAALSFDLGVLTNLHGAPLDQLAWHNTQQAYRQTKRRLFRQLSRQGAAVVNADDPGSMDLADELPCPVLTFGLHQQADIGAAVLERNRGEQTFLLTAGSDSAAVRTRMLGDFHVQNCLAAAAAGLVLGVSFPDVVRGLEAVEYVPGRLERIAAGQRCGVFWDRSSDPRTISRNLAALRPVTSGKLICVFGSAAADSQELNALRGRAVERGADWGIVTASRLNRKASLHSLHEVLDGWRRPARAHLMPDRQAALQLALDTAAEADTVLVAGGDDAERDLIDALLRDTADAGPLTFPIWNYRGA